MWAGRVRHPQAGGDVGGGDRLADQLVGPAGVHGRVTGHDRGGRGQVGAGDRGERAVAERRLQAVTTGLGEYRARLLADHTLLPFQPPMLASIATSVRHGFLGAGGPDLVRLLGRPATDPLAVAADVAASMRPAAA